MNLIANVSRRRTGWTAPGAWLLLFVLLAAPAWSAQPPAGKRFLFLVDTSAGMKPLDMALRQTLFDLIYSGARGSMTNGDTYGVWLVGDQTDTSFPMETWRAKFAVEMGAKAVSHLKDHGFKGHANFTPALADVNRIVKNVEDLTVILVSNGETPLAGTPFDEAINARAGELAPEMKLKKATVNTALVAQEGKFVAWALNSPQFLVEVPQVAPRSRPVKPTPPPAEAPVAAAKPAGVVAPPRVAANPIIITKESVAEERRSYVSSATTTNKSADAPAVIVATNIVSTVPAVASNAVVNVVTNQTNPVAQAAPVAPNPAVAALVLAPTNESKFTNAVAATVVTPPTAAAPARGLSFIFLCAGAGAGGAFLIVLCVLFFSRGRREPSLISQAIARERLQVR